MALTERFDEANAVPTSIIELSSSVNNMLFQLFLPSEQNMLSIYVATHISIFNLSLVCLKIWGVKKRLVGVTPNF